MDKLKVLVVDDKKIISDMFNLTLGHIGHTIKAVCDSDEALELIAKEYFDVAFLDVVMPNKDGVEVLEEMKSVSPDLPVIMMSGFRLNEKVNRLHELGAKGCLKKPFAIDDMRKVVKEATGKEI